MTGPHESIGTIVDVQANLVVVELESGERVLCRSVKRLHQPLGFVAVPYGRRVKIRQSQRLDRKHVLVEVLADEEPDSGVGNS